MHKGIDWDDLRLVLGIARGEGLSGAARSLGLNHATLFRRLNQLEARIGVRLFERFRTGYATTAAGEKVVALADRIESGVVQVTRELSGQDMRPQGTVRLTTTDALLPLIGRCLPHLNEANPEITIELCIVNMMVNLSRRDADIALRATGSPPPDLFGRKVGRFVYGVYAARGLRTARTDLSALPWVAPDDTVSHTPSAVWMTKHMPSVTVAGRGNSLLSILELVRAGTGVGLLPCLLADQVADLRQIGKPAPMALDLWLLTHNDLRNVARVRATMTALADGIARNQPLLSGKPARRPPARSRGALRQST
jgi:DNA-binding transcriptional LysR family regulator